MFILWGPKLHSQGFASPGDVGDMEGKPEIDAVISHLAPRQALFSTLNIHTSTAVEVLLFL